MKQKLRLIIVGGVAGGASAAARARRLSEDAEIILFERGKYISFANCGLPYHIGGEITNRDLLSVQTPEKMRQRFKIDVRTQQEVITIDRTQKRVVVHNHLNNQEYVENYDKLILSPGAYPMRPPIPGIENKLILSLRSMEDMDVINNLISNYRPRKAVVVGGGYIGLEMTEALCHRNIEVDLVEMAPQVMGPMDQEMATLLHQELILNGVNLHLSSSIIAFEQSEHGILAVLSDKNKLAADLIIFAIGVKPETVLAEKANLKLGITGGILVNDTMQTSDADIYAVGDAVEIKDFVSKDQALIPLAGPANRQGRIAADNIFGRGSIYHDTQGTGICRIFNQTAGMTGLNERILQKKKISYEKIYINASAHASYYPNAMPLSLKILFASGDGKILGAQAIGASGIDKRIDVLATYMRAGKSVYDLEHAELAYAPPYNSVKDPINYAGFVASNMLHGDMLAIYAENIKCEANAALLDVRTAEEFSAGTISGAINVPLDEIRDRLNEIPKNKTLIVFCKVGLRGYLACRILMQHGFICKNIMGGYLTYLMVNNKLQVPSKPRKNNTNVSSEVDNSRAKNLKTIDARYLQCPGPIQQLKLAIEQMHQGEEIAILTTDPGFINDAPAWCECTQNEFIQFNLEQGCCKTIIRKGISTCVPNKVDKLKKLTIVVFSIDFDRIMAAFIIANGAAAMGYEVTLFFTFWGLNVLRQSSNIKLNKTFLEKMFGVMMPKGYKKLALSKMNMLGIGPAMIKYIMRQKHALSLDELIEQAVKQDNIHLVACSMSMDLMGIKKAELIEGVQEGGVAMYLNEAGQGQVNLFI